MKSVVHSTDYTWEKEKSYREHIGSGFSLCIKDQQWDWNLQEFSTWDN